MTTLATKFGRFQVPETEETLLTSHVHDGTPLKAVNWEPKNGVLDQEDLIEQGIDTSALIAGASKVGALGSCTANATMSALSNVMSETDYLAFTKATSYGDVVGIEKAAILFYHQCTDQTGRPDEEWPPTDCGSSGPYIVWLAQKLGLISGAKIAHGAQNIVSLLQTGGLATGQPFLKAWMEPNALGFIDGNGSTETLKKQIAGGVAGGHETYLCEIVDLQLTETGAVVPEKTIIRFRNSWTVSWGDQGDYLAHLSTYVALGSACDFRQFQPVAG